YVALRIAVLHEAQLLGFELGAGTGEAVHEDDGVEARRRRRGTRLPGTCGGDGQDCGGRKSGRQAGRWSCHLVPSPRLSPDVGTILAERRCVYTNNPLKARLVAPREPGDRPARSLLTWTLPPSTASVASERVLKKRAAHSHLSTRTRPASGVSARLMDSA